MRVGLETLAPSSMIQKEVVEQIKQTCNIDDHTLLKELISFAQTLSLPEHSNYQVGAVMLGVTGNIYFGANLEIKGLPLNEASHAEQSLIANARLHGETKPVAIAVSAAPCGHCRQFMNEMGEEICNDLLIITPEGTKKFTDLLISPFGPKDLGVQGGLMNVSEKFVSTHSDALTKKAMEAAYASYSPHTHTPSGIAIRTKDGRIFQGCYLENAGYNPSLSPLQSALVSMMLEQIPFTEISEVVLVEKESGQFTYKDSIDAILRRIAKEAKFTNIIVPDFS